MHEIFIDIAMVASIEISVSLDIQIVDSWFNCFIPTNTLDSNVWTLFLCTILYFVNRYLFQIYNVTN